MEKQRGDHGAAQQLSEIQLYRLARVQFVQQVLQYSRDIHWIDTMSGWISRLVVIGTMLVSSCILEHDALIPKYPNSVLADGDPIPVASRLFLEGVYKITSGEERFGTHAVLKWHGKDFSIFS